MCKESIIIVSLCRNGCWFDFWIWASGKSWDNVFLHQSLLSVGEKYNTGWKGQPDKVGMPHPSLAIHSCSLCGLITPSAPKSAARIEVPSEFPKVQLHSQQEPWTWLQNSQAGVAVTSFNSPDCRFFSGNILAFQGSPGTSMFNGRNQDPKADMVFTLQNRGGILQSNLPGNRQIATFSDRHHLDFLIFTLLGPHSLISLVFTLFTLLFHLSYFHSPWPSSDGGTWDNSAWSVSSQPLRNSLCMIKPPFWNALVKLQDEPLCKVSPPLSDTLCGIWVSPHTVGGIMGCTVWMPGLKFPICHLSLSVCFNV